jgi:hypothetical protein
VKREWLILSTIDDYLAPMLFATEREADERMSQLQKSQLARKGYVFQKFRWSYSGWRAE